MIIYWLKFKDDGGMDGNSWIIITKMASGSQTLVIIIPQDSGFFYFEINREKKHILFVLQWK